MEPASLHSGDSANHILKLRVGHEVAAAFQVVLSGAFALDVLNVERLPRARLRLRSRRGAREGERENQCEYRRTTAHIRTPQKGFQLLLGTRRITRPGVDADRLSPVPAPVGFCSATYK